jgi:hypothetical protein
MRATQPYLDGEVNGKRRDARMFKEAVARVTENNWTACAVLDNLGFGLGVGGELDVATTLCHEIRGSHQTIVIKEAFE